MGVPAVVMGDRIVGMCPIHMIPGPGGPQPSPPLPFSAPLTMSLAPTVLIGGKPAAVQGSFGFNTPPHAGIVDPPYAGPPAQQGKVVVGSTTVLFEGKPAAKTGSTVTCCVTPGQLVGSAATVLIGG